MDREVHDIVQEGVTKTIPKKKCKKGKMAVRGGLTRRRRKEVKGKGERERYTHLNAV